MNAGRHLHRCKRRKAPLVVRLSSCALQCAKKGVCYTENMKLTHELRSLSDDELLRHLSKIIQESRRVEADLIAHIAEVDERRLYAREACSSMHVYCTEVLHLSDAEAYSRIGAARHSRMFPALLTMLEDGRLHLSAIALLSPHLTKRTGSMFLHVQCTNRSTRSRSSSPSSRRSPMFRQQFASYPLERVRHLNSVRT